MQLPRLYLAWHRPASYAPGDAATTALAAVLAGGKNSRLYKRLVYDLQIAQDVAAYQDGNRLGGAFYVVATARPGHTLDELRAVIDEEIARVQTGAVEPRELQRIVNQTEASFLDGLEERGRPGKANQLNRYLIFTGTPDYFEEDLARFRALAPRDVSDAALTFLARPPRRALDGARRAGRRRRTPRLHARRPQVLSRASPTRRLRAEPKVRVAEPKVCAAERAPPSPLPIVTGEVPEGRRGLGLVATFLSPCSASPFAPPRSASRSPPRAAALAQTAPAPQPRPRALPPTPRFAMAPVERFALSNGLPVLFVEKPGVPIVQVNLVVKRRADERPGGRERPRLVHHAADGRGRRHAHRPRTRRRRRLPRHHLSPVGGLHALGVNLHTPVSKLAAALP